MKLTGIRIHHIVHFMFFRFVMNLIFRTLISRSRWFTLICFGVYNIVRSGFFVRIVSSCNIRRIGIRIPRLNQCNRFGCFLESIPGHKYIRIRVLLNNTEKFSVFHIDLNISLQIRSKDLHSGFFQSF